VPKLVVCKGDGSVITYRGRSEVESKLALAVYNWLDAAKPKPATKQVINGFVSMHLPLTIENLASVPSFNFFYTKYRTFSVIRSK